MKEISKKIFQERKSNANYWFNKSADLHSSARVLWQALETNPVSCWSTYQMLCGMALELLFKSIIVAHGNDPKATHRLDELAKAAGINPEPQELQVLRLLSESVIWDGRYPIPKNEEYFESYNSIKIVDESLDWDEVNTLWHRGADVFHSL